MSERDVRREITVETVPREDRARLGVELGGDVCLLLGLRRTEPPLGVAEHAEPPWRLSAVRQPQQ